MFHKTLADGFFVAAALAVLIAMFGWSIVDIWLASTQWMLVAIFLVLTAIYIKLSKEEDEAIMKVRNKELSRNKKRLKKKGKEKQKHVSFRLSE